MYTTLSQVEDTSYSNFMPSLTQYPRWTLESDTATIAPPSKVLAKELPRHLRLPPPSASLELTPPPSPPAQERSTSRFSPFLSRASSVLSRRSSMSPRQPSPVRASVVAAQSPMRECPPPLGDTQPVSPTKSTAERVNTASAAVTGFFQGTSDLVSDLRFPSFKVEEKQYTVRTKTPGNQGSLSSSRGLLERISPISKQIEDTIDTDFELLNLDFAKELFPDPRGNETEAPLEKERVARKANSLYMRLVFAYQARVRDLRLERSRTRALEEAHEAEKARAIEFRQNVESFSKINEDLQSQIDRLSKALKEEQRRKEETRAIYSTLGSRNSSSFSSHQLSEHQTYSGESNGMYSIREADSDMVEDDSASESEAWSPPESLVSSSRPSTSSSSSTSSSADFEIEMLRREVDHLKTENAELLEAVNGCLSVIHDI